MREINITEDGMGVRSMCEKERVPGGMGRN